MAPTATSSKFWMTYGNKPALLEAQVYDVQRDLLLLAPAVTCDPVECVLMAQWLGCCQETPEQPVVISSKNFKN